MDLDIKNPEQIKALIEMLQSLLPTESSDKLENTEIAESKIKTKTRRSGGTNHTNKFLDMPEKDMHKADVRIDKKLSVNPPTPRNRKFSTIEVSCRSCGKKEKVSPQIVPDSLDRYKCNQCSSSGG
jgi:hypothetical protein